LCVCGLFSSSLCLPQEFPIRSNLDPALYGPPESAITKELLEQELSGMSLEQVCSIPLLLLSLTCFSNRNLLALLPITFVLLGYRGEETVYP